MSQPRPFLFPLQSLVVLLALLLSISTLTACGGGGDDETREETKAALTAEPVVDETQDPIVEDGSAKSCEYRFDEGGKAVMSNAGRIDRVDSGMFGKTYNRPDLEAVLGASGAETARYAQAIDIYLRRIPFNGTSPTCLFQSPLPVASDEILNFWKSVTGGRLNNGKAGVDGLYKTHHVDGKNVQLILVRTSSERWTLVHELMHANFHSSRTAQGQPEEFFADINSQSALVNQAIRDFSISKNEETMNKLADSLSTLGYYMRTTLTNYALEEVANESLLIEEFAAGRLKNVPRKSLLNAAWYINCSRESAFEKLNKLNKMVRQYVIAPSNLNGWTWASSVGQTTLDEINALQVRAQELATRAKMYTGATDEDVACDSTNAVVKARLKARLKDDNGHLDYMLNTNPSVRAINNAFRDINQTARDLQK